MTSRFLLSRKIEDLLEKRICRRARTYNIVIPAGGIFL